MRRTPVAILALAVALGACSSSEPTTAPTTSGTSTGAAETSAAPVRAADANPVIADDFPDPDVLEVDGVYYAYATNSGMANVQVARSEDLRTWERLDDALPVLPTWVIPGKTWAPEVTQLGPEQFVLYFTATSFDPALQCLGVATSSSPEGPFEMVGDEMLVCPPDEGGAIDAATFQADDGTWHLLWKNDGNCCGFDTWLQIAPLTADGTALAGPVTKLIQQDQPWEGNLVEAPTLVERDGIFTLLYSANDYGGDQYVMGAATATDLLGPYTKHPDPILSTDSSDGAYIGPGGQDVVVGPDGTDHLVFHSWYAEDTYRGMNVVPLEWDGGVPVPVLD